MKLNEHIFIYVCCSLVQYIGCMVVDLNTTWIYLVVRGYYRDVVRHNGSWWDIEPTTSNLFFFDGGAQLMRRWQWHDCTIELIVSKKRKKTLGYPKTIRFTLKHLNMTNIGWIWGLQFWENHSKFALCACIFPKHQMGNAWGVPLGPGQS